MSGGFPMQEQVQALLARVERTTQERCAAAQAQADAQIRQILGSAHAEARAQVRRAVAEERSRLAAGLRQAQAQADLEQRQQEQRTVQQLLVRMWEHLPGLLEAAWRDPVRRRGWIEAALGQAGTLLGGRPWVIEHGGDIPDSEHGGLAELARSEGAREVAFRREGAMGPGLRIRSQGVCVAATIPGLLARREDVEAAFLAGYLEEGDRADPEAGPGLRP